jgi:hypothetical protein
MVRQNGCLQLSSQPTEVILQKYPYKLGQQYYSMVLYLYVDIHIEDETLLLN